MLSYCNCCLVVGNLVLHERYLYRIVEVERKAKSDATAKHRHTKLAMWQTGDFVLIWKPHTRLKRHRKGLIEHSDILCNIKT
jgi:predicted ferric reductase